MSVKFPEIPEIREIAAPITERMLRPLDLRCEVVQTRFTLTDADWRQLAEFMGKYPNVKLRVYGGTMDLGFLRYFPFLRHFQADLGMLTDLEQLRHLPSTLQSLTIGRTKKTLSLKVLRAFPELRKLALDGERKDFETISSLARLERLTIRSITLTDLSALVPLENLWWLAIKLGGTRDLGLLPSIGRLKYLELWLIRGLTNVAPIGDVVTLQFLFLQALRNVTRLPSFRRLKNLRALYIETLKGLRELAPIAEAESLEDLAIVDSPQISLEQIATLKGMPSLRRATIGLGSMKRNWAAERLFNLPPIKPLSTDFEFR